MSGVRVPKERSYQRIS